MRTHAVAVLVAAVAGVGVAAVPGGLTSAQPHRGTAHGFHYPILFHVVAGAVPVADEAWMRLRTDAADRAFSPAGVSFVAESRPAAAEVPDHVQSRAERDALQRHLVDGVVNVFVVSELRSYERDGGIIRGVHWHRTQHRGERGEHYIIVAQYAAEYVLAHELGHFFGNPRHTHLPGNLMSYIRGEGVPWLNPAQIRRIRRAAERYGRTGELVAR